MTYLGKDASGNFRYEYAVNVNWEGDTPHNIINFYFSLEGGAPEYFFLFQVGTGQTGSDAVEFPIGSHLPGAHIIFWASVPGVITSNEVSIIVGEGAPPPVEPFPEVGLPLIAGAGLAIADAALIGCYLATVFGLI